MRASLAVIIAAVIIGSMPVAALGEAVEKRTTVAEVSRDVVCPTCETTLDNSNSPSATRMRSYIEELVDEGLTQAQIERELVREYGGDESILAAPDVGGKGSIAWFVPGAIAFMCLLIGTTSVVRWRRNKQARGPRGNRV